MLVSGGEGGKNEEERGYRVFVTGKLREKEGKGRKNISSWW